jgi:CrcB protein
MNIPGRRESEWPPVASSPDSPVDPDIEAAPIRPITWDVLLVIAIGGVLGSEARYGLDRLIPARSSEFPWATLLINVSGCALIGFLMVALTHAAHPHRLVRPLLATGVLGGYTTFSAFALDSIRLGHAHRPGLALAYVLTTVVAAAVAIWLATVIGSKYWPDRGLDAQHS